MADGKQTETFTSKEAAEEYSTQLLSQFLFLRKTNAMTDVTLICEQSKELKAHSIILSAASPYFTAVPGTTGDRYDFRSTDAADLEVVLDFMYSGKVRNEDEIKNDLDRLASLLEISQHIQVLSLAKWCLHRLGYSLDFSNYQEMYELANESNCEPLISRIVTFIVRNFVELLLTKQIQELGPDLMTRILHHPEMVLIPLDTTVRAILQWVEYDVERKPILGNLIQILDLTYLSRDCLSTLLGNRLIKNDRHVITILMAESTRRAMIGSPDVDFSFGQQLVCFGKNERKRIMRVYDIDSNQWLTAQTPPFPLELGMTLVGYGHNVYLFGSCGWPPFPTTAIIKYNPMTNIASESEGSLTEAICRAGAVVVDDVIYVINGLNEEKKRVNTVQCYRPREGLSVIVAPTSSTHVCPQAFAFNNCFYLVGSLSDAEKSVECYNPLGDHWTIITRIPGSIHWCRVALCDSQLFVIRRKDELKALVYDILTGEWTSRQLESSGPKKTDWGIWAAKKNGKLILLVRDGSNILYSYDVEAREWGGQSESNINPWHYKLTCVIWK